MQTILVPTDFSEDADHAMQYAKEFAGLLSQPVGLVLLHALEKNAPRPEAHAPVPKPREDAEHGAVEKLRYYARSFSRQAGIRSCRIMAAEGRLNHVIGSGTRRVSADLVLMPMGVSSTGHSGFRHEHATALMQEVPAPVLLLPRQHVFMPLRNLVFAADLLHTELTSLLSILRMAESLRALLHVVHITATDDAAERHRVQHLWSDALRHVLTHQSHLYLLHSDSVEQGLQSFLQKHNADLLVVCSHRHPSLHNYLQKSPGSHNGSKSQLPLLVLPHHSHAPAPTPTAEASVFAHDQVEFIM